MKQLAIFCCRGGTVAQDQGASSIVCSGTNYTYFSVKFPVFAYPDKISQSCYFWVRPSVPSLVLYSTSSWLLWWSESGPWDSTRMLEQTDETTFLMPAEAGFAKDVKSRQTCMFTLSFLEANLFFRQSTFLPSLAHMAFWTIRHESPQTFTFFLPVETSKVFFCTAFFSPQFIIPVAFLKILWAPPKPSTIPWCFSLGPSEVLHSSIWFFFPCPKFSQTSSFCWHFIFAGIFGKWGNKFSAGTDPWINRFAALLLMD